mgnify:CR=1 FL=1
MKHKKTDKTFYHFSRIFRHEEVDRRKKKIIAAAFISYCVIRFISYLIIFPPPMASKKRPFDVVHISRCLTFLTPPASFTPKNVSYWPWIPVNLSLMRWTFNPFNFDSNLWFLGVKKKFIGYIFNDYVILWLKCFFLLDCHSAYKIL